MVRTGFFVSYITLSLYISEVLIKNSTLQCVHICEGGRSLNRAIYVKLTLGDSSIISCSDVIGFR